MSLYTQETPEKLYWGVCLPGKSKQWAKLSNALGKVTRCLDRKGTILARMLSISACLKTELWPSNRQM